MQDRVPQARIYKVWNVPQWDSADADYLTLLAHVLSTGKSSRLYKRLVYDEQIATDVAAYTDLREIGGLFVIQATARPGGDLAPVEQAIDEELARLLATGPTAAELAAGQDARTAPASCAASSASAGSAASPTCWPRARSSPATPSSTRPGCAGSPRRPRPRSAAPARRWLADGVYTLEVVPFPEYAHRRRRAPTARSCPTSARRSTAASRRSQRDTLSNGLKIVFARRTAMPQVRLDLLLDAGYAADQFGVPGTASLAMAMLDEGTRTRALDPDQRRAGRARREPRPRAPPSTSRPSRSTRCTTTSIASLALFADVILNPSFPQADFERLKRQRLAQIRREKAEPVGMALRVLPRLLYGEGHAYANPWTGSGTEASTRQDHPRRPGPVPPHLVQAQPCHADRGRRHHAGRDQAQARAALRRVAAGGRARPRTSAGWSSRPRSTVYLIDRPDAIQSLILAGDIAPPKANPDEPSIETMNTVLGGTFTLAHQHEPAGGQALVVRRAHLLPRRAGPAALRGLRPGADRQDQGSVGGDRQRSSAASSRDRPATPEELARAKAALTLTLPGGWETMDAVLGDDAARS